LIDRRVHFVGKSLVTKSGFALHNTPRHKLFPVSIASMKDTMLSSLSLHDSRRTIIAAPVLLLLIWLFVGTPYARAQKRKSPAPNTQATQNANTSTAAQPKSLRKKLTAPRSSDSSEGSRVTIASDGVLNDYSAYRSGNRFYVVIPQADAPQTASRVRGRGFDNVQVQKRGGDAVISFQLQPGTAARVNQKFNKLDVVFSASAVPPLVSTGNPKSSKLSQTQKPGINPRVNDTKFRNSSAILQSNTGIVPAETKQPIFSGTRLNPTANANIGTEPNRQQRQSNNNALLPTPNSGAPVQSQSTVSNAANASASPLAAAPPAGEIAQQTHPAPIVPAGTGAGDTNAANTTTSSNSTGSLGAVLARNWPLALIAALVLGVLGVAFAMRSSSGSQPDTAAQHAAIRQGILDAPDKQISPVPESTNTPTAATTTNFAPTNSAVPMAAATMATMAAAELAPESEALPDFADEATKEVEVIASPVDVERAEVETQNVLAGEPYDETIIGTKDRGARQMIAAGFLAALAGRNLQKHGNARAAFIKHGYFDEATRDLRDAEAPAERTSAARTLGLVRDTAATPHLVAALEDASPEVRRAAVEALAEVRDPQAVAPLEALRDREKNRKEKTRKIPRALIQRAVEASIIGQEKAEAPTRVIPIPPAPHVAEDANAAPFASAFETPFVEAAHMAADDSTLASAEAALAPSIETARDVADDAASQYSEAPALHEAEVIHATDTVETFSPAPAEIDDSTIETAPPATLDHSFVEVADGSAHASTFQSTLPVVEEESPAEIFESNLADEAITETQFAPPLSPQQEIVQSSVIASETSPSVAYSLDSLIERHDAPAQGWVEVDMSEPEIISHATPVKSSAVDASAAPEAFIAEHIVEEATSRATSSFESVAPVSPEIFEETLPPVSAGQTEREIDVAVADKSIERFGDELSTVPSAILKRLASEDAIERASAVEDLARVSGEDSFREISASFDDPAQEVRNAAAHALFNLNADRAASFTRALREAPPERRRKIGSALATSGLANDAIGHLMGESREKTYDAFSLLFLMSKAGEVQPLMKAIEEYPNNEVRLAVVKLLALSGQQEILPAFRRLAVRGSLPTEVRSAVMEAIYQISSQTSSDAPSAA